MILGPPAAVAAPAPNPRTVHQRRGLVVSARRAGAGRNGPADRREKFDNILKAKTSSWANDKINIIRGIMNSWWVSDEDVARIVAICGTASPEDLKLLHSAFGPEVSNLNNEGQRARIRMALGM